MYSGGRIVYVDTWEGSKTVMITIFGISISYNLFWTLALMAGGILVIWIGFILSRIGKTLTWISWILEDILLAIRGAENEN